MSNEKRIYSLDFIKIIATIIILLHHYQLVNDVYFEHNINFYNGKFYFGYLVEMFFLLSGLFMFPYIEKIQRGLNFKSFILKRILRFLPLSLITTVVHVVLLLLYKYICKGTYGDESISLWGIIVSSLEIQEGWMIKNIHINNPTWYISVLMLCYVLFYFEVYLAERLSINPQYFFVIMIFIGFAINTYNIDLPLMSKPLARGYYSFFYGILIYKYLFFRKKKITVALITILVETYLIIFHFGFMNEGINYIMTFTYYPMLIIIFMSNYFKNIFKNKIWGVFGEISFNVYMWHFPLLLFCRVLVELFHFNVNYNSILVMFFYTVICFTIGIFSYFLIDLPFSKYINEKCIYDCNLSEKL